MVFVSKDVISLLILFRFSFIILIVLSWTAVRAYRLPISAFNLSIFLPIEETLSSSVLTRFWSSNNTETIASNKGCNLALDCPSDNLITASSYEISLALIIFLFPNPHIFSFGQHYCSATYGAGYG